jgi:hypothetical protein
MGLVTVSGYYYVVIDFGFAVIEVEADSPVLIVGYGFHGRVEEYMVWWEAFHYGIDVALGAVFESQPGWSC